MNIRHFSLDEVRWTSRRVSPPRFMYESAAFRVFVIVKREAACLEIMAGSQHVDLEPARAGTSHSHPPQHCVEQEILKNHEPFAPVVSVSEERAAGSLQVDRTKYRKPASPFSHLD